jgi:hypothetical protein
MPSGWWLQQRQEIALPVVLEANAVHHERLTNC